MHMIWKYLSQNIFVDINGHKNLHMIKVNINTTALYLHALSYNKKENLTMDLLHFQLRY